MALLAPPDLEPVLAIRSLRTTRILHRNLPQIFPDSH
jgi:hypothetical protein